MGGVSERKRWQFGLGLILLINLFGLHYLLRWEQMWTGDENHDTRIMYKHIRLADEPLKWFRGDWPLYNGFYRPIPALAFEADVRLWGTSYRKYKILNWLVCASCSILMAYFLRSLTQDNRLALGAAGLFSLWQTGVIEFLPVSLFALPIAAGAFVFGLARDRKRLGSWVLISFAVLYLGSELALQCSIGDLSDMTFGYRTMGWPPGRTATLMVLFALTSVLGYVEWERQREARWFALACFGFLGAFLCYEQAVMLPAVIFACGLFMGSYGVRVRWWPHVLFWGVLAAYGWWHMSCLPIDPAYARTHDRAVSNGFMELGYWVLPAASVWPVFANLSDPVIGWLELFLPSFWWSCLQVAGNVAGLTLCLREWKLALFGLGVSLVAYMPMAFQLQLDHYLYFPAVFRAIFVVVFARIVWRRVRDLLTESAIDRPQSAATFATSS